MTIVEIGRWRYDGILKDGIKTLYVPLETKIKVGDFIEVIEDYPNSRRRMRIRVLKLDRVPRLIREGKVVEEQYMITFIAKQKTRREAKKEGLL
jgi:hypothetical protein